ncbi:hypothetical protein MMC22_010044 [Lobaria immixta]|nr:hypothetical protein [Lobaria immixta]
MSDVIRSRSVDELHDLNLKQRLDTLITMSIEMLDSLTPVELRDITFDWFRAYHATMQNCNYVEIKQINTMAPQLRRNALHNIILSRDDRSFDQVDELIVQRLRAIFNDRKSKAGHALFISQDTHVPTSTNEFSVDEDFFSRTPKPWAAQADELSFDAFNISGVNNRQQRSGDLTSDRDLRLDLEKLNLKDQASESSANTTNQGQSRRRKAALSRRREAELARHESQLRRRL